jgi:ribosome-associated protein
METLEFHLTGEFIALNDLLKAAGVAPSGGAGKALVASGKVRVDRVVELRKTCKIRPGQSVTVGGVEIVVRRAEPA